MKKIWFYDTETTGMPDWTVPSDSDTQPHLVQLAGILCNAETREVISTMDVIIKPNGWIIPQETIDVHGISQEFAEANGIDELEAVQQFLAMVEGANRVAHNRTFDQRIIRIAMKRYGLSEQALEAWAEKDNHECTMLKAKPIMQLPGKGKAFKNPTLAEAFKHFTGEELQGAHTAMGDAKGCMAVYWAMCDLEKVPS